MEPFKNLLGDKAAAKIARALERAHPEFSSRAFLRNIKHDLEALELKGRMLLLAKRLEAVLPNDPRESFQILKASLQTNEEDKVGLSGFLVWPLTQFVSEYGQAHFKASMQALEAMTKVFTAEFAIRRFLINHEAQTLKTLMQWTDNDNEHVRRLASEGSRPLLPWGERLPSFIQNPEKTWPLLERLKNDPAEYVRKSVANHINDHSKHHGDWVVKNLNTWAKLAIDVKHLDWIIRHGTRTLVKKGHQGALALHGIESAGVELVSRKIVTPKLCMGDFLEVEVKIKNNLKKVAAVMIDHQLLLLGTNGKYRAKVFKGKKLALGPLETKSLRLQIRIKPVTVRKYYSGRQQWSILVNGKASKPLPFQLAN